jgi:MEMO1 family protein
VLSPHIDYARGGPVYARGWRQASSAARAAESAIILGTDHAGGLGRLTLSTPPYATPWGATEPWSELHDALVGVLGDEACFAEELHHRNEHSVELALVWLQHVRGGRPLRVLPVLCGYPAPYFDGGFGNGDTPVGAALALLREAVEQGALVVVAGDLAHVGPAFGDPRPFGKPERQAVKLADEALLAACSRGSVAALRAVADSEDRYRICGLAPLALAIEIMPPVRFEQAAYDQCPADAEDHSFVSVAGGCFVRA